MVDIWIKLVLFTIFLIYVDGFLFSGKNENERPNIVIIMADDLVRINSSETI